MFNQLTTLMLASFCRARRSMLSLMAACGFVLASPLSTAQVRLEHWQTHTSLYNARCAKVDSKGTVWIGTTGGLYSAQPGMNNIQVFRNIDALLSLDISALAVEPGTDAIYVGCSDGSISIYRNGSWEYVTSIRAKGDEFPSVQINDFLFDGNRVFIAGGFGITVYYPATRTFGATVTNFNGSRNVPVNSLISWQDRLWAATNNGVFSAPLTTQQFNLPSIWKPYAFNDFAEVPIARTLAVYADTLLAGLGKQIWKLTADEFVATMELDTTVTSILPLQGKLFVSDLFAVRQYPDIVLYDKRRTNNEINALVALPSSEQPSVLFSKFGFANIVSRDSLTLLTPNSPQSNLFMDMTVDANGALWTATIKDNAGSGFSRLDGSTWKNFTVDNYPELLTDAYVQINTGANGEMWASSWGFGLAHLTPNGNDFDITVYESSNSPIKGIFTGGDFEVLGETETDQNGVTWIVEHAAVARPNHNIIARAADGTFYTFSNPAGKINNWYFNSLAIDRNGTKWLAAPNDESGNVLIYFNDRGTLSDKTDDVWGTLDANSTSLPSTWINGIAVDDNGVIWLAGNEGLYAIDNPYAVLSKSRLFTRFVPALAGQSVNCVMVDALNQKWVGTNSGVWVLNNDGTEVLGRFNKDNTPLLDNVISSLANNPASGTIYIGTRSGMSSAASLSIRANVDFNALRCYPQPFVLTEDDELRVEGLAENSVVKVATIDGVLVRTIDSRGSRAAVWDGRNDRGEFVASGVYLISGFSETSGESAVVKAMVLRKD